ncbi:hypothetical protein [Methylobacterium phyllostachyos]|nr:hypothetical protein [Methylobacterium phyllostachyos]
MISYERERGGLLHVGLIGIVILLATRPRARRQPGRCRPGR